MSLKSCLAAIAAVAALLGSTALRAEEAAAPTFVRALTVTVKPGTQPQFEEFIAKYKAAHDKMGTPAEWGAYQTVLGRENEYLFASDFGSWKDLPTSGGPLIEAYGDAEAANVLALWAGSALAAESGVWMQRSDLSRPAPAGTPVATYYISEITTIEPGTADAFLQWVQAIHKANGQLFPELRYSFFEPALAAGMRYVAFVPLADLGELDSPFMSYADRVEKVLGKKERDRLVGLIEGAITASETSIVMLRPDLSRQPAPGN